MFTCGLLRSNFSFAIACLLPPLSSSASVSLGSLVGAHDQDRTGDLVLTKDALYRLSYVGAWNVPAPPRLQPPPSRVPILRMERATGFEPATSSLEGWSSTS